MRVDLVQILEHTSIELTIALTIALSLRATLRRHFGALHAYSLWLLVPLLPLASIIPLLLPSASLPLPVQYLIPYATATRPLATHVNTIDYALLLSYVWIAGAFGALALQCWRQMQFMRGLGRIERVGGIYRSQSCDVGPALVGVWQPMIVVPFDFVTRYTEAEQELILAHERVHQERGDHLANALCALMQCVFWFHPLMHLGAARFRADQELVCDAVVVSRHRHLRKTYAGAMLKTQILNVALPAGCSWQSQYLLKERIMQLNRQPSTSVKRKIGSALVVAMVSLIVGGAWAAESTPDTASTAAIKKTYDIAMTMTLNGGTPKNVKVMTHEGEQFVIKEGEVDDLWEESFILRAKKGNVFLLESTIMHKNALLGHPSVQFVQGQPATIRIGDEQSKYELTVDAQASAKSGT